MVAKLKDLLECKTKSEVKAFANAHNIPTRETQDQITVGSWVCVFKGNKFQYVK